jgi:hypothetical protein
MPDQRQDHTALRRHFGEQLTFLIASGKAYDGGTQLEAKRIATVLRILLHHTRTSHALLVQLGWRDKWTWADTAGVLDERGLLPISNLAPLVFGGDSIEYRPKLDRWNRRPPEVLASMRARGMVFPREPGYFIDFAEWWTMAVVRDGDGQRFSRRDLVLQVTNKDGGAHVDPALPEAYYNLSRSKSFGWQVRDPDGTVIEDARISPVLPSIRQIAQEFIYTARQFWQPPDGQPDPFTRATS